MKRWLIAALVLFLLGAPCGWLFATEAGLRWTVATVEGLSNGRLTVGSAEGRLGGPLQLTDVIYADKSVRLQIDRLDLNWHPLALISGRVWLSDLQISTLTIDVLGGGGTKSAGPLNLGTPVALDVDHAVVDDFRLRTAPNRAGIAISHAELIGGWKGSWIRVERLALSHPQTGPLELSGDLALALDQLLLRAVVLRGPGEFQLQGAIALSSKQNTDLKLNWNGAHWPASGPPKVESREGEARIKGPNEDLQFDAGFTLGAAAQVKAQGRWTKGRLKAHAGWTQLGYPLNESQPPWVSQRGELELDGVPDNYDWTLNAALAAQGLPAELAAHGRGSLEGLRVEQARLQVLKGIVQAQGQVAWSKNPALDVTATLRDVDPSSLSPDWPGRINGQASVRGTWQQGRPDLKFDLALRDSELRHYPLKLLATGSYRGETLRFGELSASSGASRLHAAGQLLPDYKLDAELHSSDLNSLWTHLAGHADVEAHVRGKRSAPHIRLSGQARKLVYAQFRVGQAQLAADLDAQQPSQLQLELKDINAARQVFETLSLRGAGTAQAHTLTLSAGDGGLGADLAIQGGADLKARIWRGQWREGRISANGKSWDLEGPVPLRVAADRAALLEPACLKSPVGRACLRAEWSPAESRLAFRTENLGFAVFQPLLPADWTVEGAMSGAALVVVGNGGITTLQADLATTAGKITAGSKAQLQFLPSTLRVQPDQQQLRANVQLKLAQGEINGTARLEPGDILLDRRLAGTLNLDMPDLSWVTLLSPEFLAASGQLHAAFNLGGTLRSPLVDGKVDVADGHLQLATPGIELTGISAGFSARSDGRLTMALQTQSGGGTLKLDGVIETLKPLAAKFTVAGNNFQVANTPTVRAWITPDLKLAFSADGASLTGEIAVPKARITPRDLGKSGVAPSDDQVIVDESGAPPPDKLRLTSEVKLSLGDDVHFSGFGLKTRLTGAVTTVDEPNRPTRADGELNLQGGRYKAYGQDLEIETGRLLFTGGPPTSPAVEVRASRKPVEDVKVGLLVRGTLEKPEFSLFSEPAMAQEQQLSWLVLGRPLDQTQGSEQRNALSGAALALGLSGGTFLAEKLGKGIGLGEISVGTERGSTTTGSTTAGQTTDQTRLTVGKYLSPKLFVSYGVGLFQPGQYFKLLYDIGKGFKLSTESGVNRGGDLLYTIER